MFLVVEYRLDVTRQLTHIPHETYGHTVRYRYVYSHYRSVVPWCCPLLTGIAQPSFFYPWFSHHHRPTMSLTLTPRLLSQYAVSAALNTLQPQQRSRLADVVSAKRLAMGTPDSAACMSTSTFDKNSKYRRAHAVRRNLRTHR